MSEVQKILVVVPALNEETIIGRTVGEILQKMPPGGGSVLVVDDGSSDATARAARDAGARVVRLPYNVGVGAAVQTGLQFARRHGYDLVVRLDGDGQHDPAFLEDLIRPLREGQADMVIGSRFLPPHLGYQSSWIRRIGIRFFTRLISFLVGLAVTDPTSGYVAFNRTMIDIFAGDYPQDFPEPEAVVVALRSKARILEVPVVMRQRTTGRSSIRYLISLYYMIKVTFAILLNMLKETEALD